MAPCSTTRTIAGLLVVLWSGRLYANGCYSSIISFGDSITDTGNRKHLASISDVEFLCVSPYGQNFIGQTTGRCSNGRLIIDFLAESLGLPLIPPYLDNKGSGSVVSLRQGVNYAVGGATALDSSFFEAKLDVINASLEVQFLWFKQSFPSICGTTTSSGNFPIGCFPSYLTTHGSDKEEYDPITGCLTKLNKFVEYHNNMLQTKLNQIRELKPNVNIIYADYYNVVMQFYRSPYQYGFTNRVLKACCGCGGTFNYNKSLMCGDGCTTVCDEPDTYVSWDGRHLTQRAYKLISKSLFQGPYTTPRLYSLCPTPTSQGVVRLWSSM